MKKQQKTNKVIDKELKRIDKTLLRKRIIVMGVIAVMVLTGVVPLLQVLVSK
ncbi:hypothetical protein UT300012_21680 [Paraclostridium bifermentans]